MPPHRPVNTRPAALVLPEKQRMKPNTSKKRAGKLLVVGAVLTLLLILAVYLPWQLVFANTLYLILAAVLLLGVLIWAVSAFVEYFRHTPGD